jgi:hypothetical protein
VRWAIINKSNKKNATEGDAQTNFRGKISSLQAAVGHHASWINATYTNQSGCNLSAKTAPATAIFAKNWDTDKLHYEK